MSFCDQHALQGGDGLEDGGRLGEQDGQAPGETQEVHPAVHMT